MSDQQVAEVVISGQEYLDHRLAAGRAKMTIEPGKTHGEVVVSGYARGEAIELRLCAVTEGFNPKTGASSRCGADVADVAIPEQGSFVARYVMPEELALGDGSTVSCEEVRCALVAYDAGWPDKVFAVYDDQ